MRSQDGADEAAGSDDEAQGSDDDADADDDAEIDADDTTNINNSADAQDQDDLEGAETEPSTSADYRPVGDGSISDQADFDADAMDYDNARAVRDQLELNAELKAKGKKLKVGKKAPEVLRRWMSSAFA